MPLTLAIVCVGIGVAVFSTGLLAFDPDPRTWDTVTERLTELVVIIALMGAGLKIDRPPGWRAWATTWRLLAVAMPLTIRAGERDHDFHQEMHDFSDQVERLLMMLLLVLFGGALANGLLDALTWTDALIGLAVVFVVRPVAGLIAMLGSGQPMRERLLLAFLGIRGVGSVYYVAWGINHGDFGDSERLWAVVGFIILLSIVVHGVTATPLLERLARRRESFPAAPAPANPPPTASGSE